MIIEIRGVQFVNKGAELMLHAILQQLAGLYPSARIALEPNINSPYSERIKLGAYQKWSWQKSFLDLNRLSYWVPARVRRWLLSRWGIVTEANIDLVLDASGFAYGDQWSSRAITRLSNELLRAERYGKRYVFLPQAFGPFSRPQDVRRLAKALPRATLICAREDESLAHLRHIVGDAANLVQYPDFTNLVRGETPSYYRDGHKKVLIVPNSNMVGARNSNQQWKKNYVRVMLEAIHAIRARGLTPVLLNHEGGGDEQLCQNIREQLCQSTGESLSKSIDIIREADPIKVKGLIGSSHALVCSRFHGCVSALSQSIPCIGTSWSHKYEKLFEEYGVSKALIKADATEDSIGLLLDQHAALQAHLQERAVEMKARSIAMWQCLAERLTLATGKGEYQPVYQAKPDQQTPPKRLTTA